MTPTRGAWSFDFSALKQFLRELFHGRQPMAMYPDEIATIINYHERLEHRRIPQPWEGEVSKSHVCVFVRTFSGTREIYEVDTTVNKFSRLSFFAAYRGEREIFYNFEVGNDSSGPKSDNLP